MGAAYKNKLLIALSKYASHNLEIINCDNMKSRLAVRGINYRDNLLLVRPTLDNTAGVMKVTDDNEIVDNCGTKYKPLLYNTDILIDKMVYNGMQFYPLANLYKIDTNILPRDTDRIGFHAMQNSHDKREKEYTLLIDHKRVFCYSSYPNGDVVFRYVNESKSVLSQNKMFDKLYEWLIDINGIIDKGWAIDKSKVM